jgi:hypothetical protein
LAGRMVNEIQWRDGNGKDKKGHFSKVKHIVFQ